VLQTLITMLDYDTCSVEELERFVSQRGLPIPASHQSLKTTRNTTETRKRYYISVLDQADQNPTFPGFLELPVELRLMVFDELLTGFKSATENMGILSVNKEIRREALDSFYKCNTFVIEVRSDYVLIHGILQRAMDPVDPSELFEPRWPSCLRNVSHLRIIFAVDTTRGEWHRYSQRRNERTTSGVAAEVTLLNHVLFSLCSFLSGGNALLSVDLRFDVTRIELRRSHFLIRNSQQLNSCLAPLKMMRTLRKVVFGKIVYRLNPAKRVRESVTVQPHVISSTWKHVYDAAKSCIRLHAIAKDVFDRTPSLSLSQNWETLIRICDAAAEFDRILARPPTREVHGWGPLNQQPLGPERLSAWPFVTYEVVLGLAAQMEVMMQGLQIFKYDSKALRAVERELFQLSHEVERKIQQKLNELTTAVLNLDDLIGSKSSRRLRDATAMLNHPSVNLHWWQDVTLRFGDELDYLKWSLLHPALRKAVIVRLPIETAIPGQIPRFRTIQPPPYFPHRPRDPRQLQRRRGGR
jgi:hypothetical protein